MRNPMKKMAALFCCVFIALPAFAQKKGQEANVVRRALTFVAMFHEKGVEPLANQRAGAVTGGQGLHPQSGSALGAEVIGIADRRETFLLELRAGAERGFQLTEIGLAIVAREGEIVDVERPLRNILPDA